MAEPKRPKGRPQTPYWGKREHLRVFFGKDIFRKFGFNPTAAELETVAKNEAAKNFNANAAFYQREQETRERIKAHLEHYLSTLK